MPIDLLPSSPDAARQQGRTDSSTSSSGSLTPQTISSGNVSPVSTPAQTGGVSGVSGQRPFLSIDDAELTRRGQRLDAVRAGRSSGQRPGARDAYLGTPDRDLYESLRRYDTAAIASTGAATLPPVEAAPPRRSVTRGNGGSSMVRIKL